MEFSNHCSVCCFMGKLSQSNAVGLLNAICVAHAANIWLLTMLKTRKSYSSMLRKPLHTEMRLPFFSIDIQACNGNKESFSVFMLNLKHLVRLG